MKKIWLLAFGLLALTLAGCGIHHHNHDHQENEAPKVVKIWLVGPLSGPAANYGADMVNIHRYLADKFNQENKEVQVELVIEDGKCNGKDATSAVQKLLHIDQVELFNAAACSSEAIPVAQAVHQHHSLLLNWTASSPTLSTIGDWVFNYLNDTYAAKTLANFVDSKVKSIVLVYDNTDFGKWIAEGFKATYSGNLLKEIALSPDEKDHSLVIKQIENVNPEGLVLINGNDDSTLVNQLKELKREGMLERYKEKIFTAYLLNSQKTVLEAQELLNGVYQVNTAAVEDFGNEATSFMDTFKAQHTIEANASFILLWAEAFNLTLDAIKAGNLASESIRNYITAITPEHPRKGLIGEYYFDKGQALGVKYVIQQVQNGELITL